jgi:hypothetical protein
MTPDKNTPAEMKYIWEFMWPRMVTAKGRNGYINQKGLSLFMYQHPAGEILDIAAINSKGTAGSAKVQVPVENLRKLRNTLTAILRERGLEPKKKKAPKCPFCGNTMEYVCISKTCACMACHDCDLTFTMTNGVPTKLEKKGGYDVYTECETCKCPECAAKTEINCHDCANAENTDKCKDCDGDHWTPAHPGASKKAPTSDYE